MTPAFRTVFSTDPYVPLLTGLCLVLSLWGMSFSYSCRSDGCIGVVLPFGAASVVLLAQLLVGLPLLWWRWRQRQWPVGLVLLQWGLVTLAAVVIPVLLAN